MIIYMSVDKWSIMIINIVRTSGLPRNECEQAVHHNNKYSADKQSVMIIYMSVDKRSIIMTNIVQTSGPSL